MGPPSVTPSMLNHGVEARAESLKKDKICSCKHEQAPAQPAFLLAVSARNPPHLHGIWGKSGQSGATETGTPCALGAGKVF